MKTLIVIGLIVVASGCQNVRSTQDSPPIRSEREYAQNSEARAQSLYRSGEASSIPEARVRAAAEANREWAAAATAAERTSKQGQFEKQLSESQGLKK